MRTSLLCDISHNGITEETLGYDDRNLYAVFVAFNLAGVELSFAVSKWITFGALFASTTAAVTFGFVAPEILAGEKPGPRADLVRAALPANVARVTGALCILVGVALIALPALDPTPGIPATLSRPILTGLLGWAVLGALLAVSVARPSATRFISSE